MNKQAFLAQLSKGLSGLPRREIGERLAFYSEMIDDRMEEGLTEEEAVASVGALEEILGASQEQPKAKKRKVWTVVLLVLGSPLWISLLAAVLAVVLALYAAVWAVIVSLWAVFGALVGCAAGGIVGGTGLICAAHENPGIVLLGVGLVCGGLSVFLFFCCKAVTAGTCLLTKTAFKCCFRKREEAL